MRIQPLLLLILSLVCTNLKAQLSAYYFSAGTGTYTPITGTALSLASYELDEGTSGLKPIGFTFRYNGTDYTQLDICTNGFVQLGETIDRVRGMISGNNLPNSPLRNVLAPLWDDLRVGSSGDIRYETSGSAPNRVFTVQWSRVYWDYASANPSVEFQLKLYETTNRIEFTYNQLGAAVKDGSASIGINIAGEGSGTFYALTDAGFNPSLNSDEWRYYSINKKPAIGQVYAFFVPMPCTGTPDGGNTQSSTDLVCVGSTFKLSVSGATLAQNLSYQWQISSNGSNWQDIPSATDTNYIAQQNSDTWYRRAITCGSNTTYSSPLQVKTGVLPVQYATLPFTENFETIWLSNCGLRERPSLHLKNSVPTGNRSWRRDDDAAAGEWTSPSFNLWPGGNTSRAARFRVRDEFSAPVHSTGDLDLYVDCSPAGTKELRFRHAQTSGATSLTVWYSTDGGSNFTLLRDILGWALWKDQHIIIPSNSPTTVIRFRGQGAGYSSSSDIGIDDIQVQIMSCKFPDGLIVKDQNQTSATITWNHEAGSAYEYKLTTVRDDLIGSVQTTTDAQVQLTTDPASDYFFYVRRKCDNNNYSSWTMLPLSPSMDCSITTALNCSTPASFSIDDGYGRYNLWLTDRSNNCNGGGGYGMEKLMRIVPQISGNYKLKVTATTAQYQVTYYIKDASLGCGPYNWTCLGNTFNPVTFDLGSLSAGKEYFLLIDLSTIVNGHNETLELICTGTNADCVTGSITPAGPISICAGENQQLLVGGGTSWQWFRNGAIIDGAITNSYTSTQNGNYSVAVTNGTCTTVSNTVTVDIKSFTAPVVTFTGTTNLCEGETLQLSTTTVSGNNYQWQKNGTDINNAISENYTVSATGNYTVKASSSDGCSAVSNSVNITVNVHPAKPVITSGGVTTFCEGSNVVLSSSASSGNQWYKDGTTVTGNQTYTATQTGNYTVIATVNGCASEASAVVSVTVKALPAVPTITAGAGNTLSSSASAGNQWYKDGTLLTGATSQNYTATASGVYTVQVTQNGCSASSTGFNFVFTGIVDPSAWGNDVSVYPNPVVRDLFVKNIRQRQLQIQLIDIAGRPVYASKLINSSKTIGLHGIASGIYQLLITDLRKKETVIFRIIKL